MAKPKSTYRTFLIEWKYEDLVKGIERSEIEEYKVQRLNDSDSEVQVALSYVLLCYKHDKQPRWQGYFIANHAFVWDKPMEYMYAHAALDDFEEFGIKADRIEV